VIPTPKHTIALLAFFAAFSAAAQDFSNNNWYFTGNNRGLVFGKQEQAEPIIDRGKVSQLNPGEKVTITDPISGELIAYSDGINVYDASHQVMVNGNSIFSDSDGVQSMAVSPVPGLGSENRYYIFHRDDAGQIFASIVDFNLPGNRSDGPPLGGVLDKNIPMGVSGRGDGMLTVANDDGTTFWLITQQANGGMIEIFEIPVDGGTLTSAGLVNLTTPIITESMSFHNPTGRIALIPSNDTNIQVLNFNPNVPEITFDQSILNSFVLNETFGGTAGWSTSGDYIYFSRNSNTEGNLYRYNLVEDSLAAIEPVLTTPVQESFSIKMAPDSSLYHLYRDSPGGGILLGRLSQSDSLINVVEYEGELFDADEFNSEFFASFTPPESIQPQIFAMAQMEGLCMNNPIQFYPIFEPDNVIPTSINWEFQPVNINSGGFAPLLTFEQAGPVTFTVTAEINGRFYTSAQEMIMIEENDLQVSLPDTTICPGEVLELNAEPESGGQGQQGGASGGPFTYLWNTGDTTSTIEVSEAGNYWVVVTPDMGCPVYATTEVRVYGVENRTANIWYFGEGAGIDFNEIDGLDPPPRSITEAHAMVTPAGTSTISDQGGQVLFYSNGVTVWNSDNEVMPNGTEIGGDSLSTQSVIIVPFVDDETLYYVFTTQQVYGENTYELKYSIVDMKEDDGKGDVVIKDNVLFTRSTERLAAFEAGGGFWLMAHEYGNNTFRAYPITENGIGTPVLSSVGSIHSTNDPLSGQAGMKFSNDGMRLAVALIIGDDDFAEIFTFDQLTGEVTELEYAIDLNEGGAGNDQVYDVHFSNGGNKFFATMNNRNGGSPNGRIIEYRVDTASTEDSRLASRNNIADGISGLNFGQVQTGPDGQLYVATEGEAFVGAIIANEDTAAFSAYNAQQVFLTTGISTLGLPNFVQNNASPEQQPGMSADTLICVDQLLELSGGGTSDIDELTFSITSILDNSTVFTATATETIDTSYVFSQEQAGLYNVSLNIANRCGFDTTIVQSLEVLGIPEPPTVPQAISICEPNGTTLDAGQGVDTSNLTFEWTDSRGTVVSTAQVFTIENQDIYTVTIFNQLGCSSSREIFAGPPFEIQLPPTAVICEGASLTLDPQVTANNYIWTIINPDNSTTTLPNQRRATIDSSVPGQYTYVVSVEDPITVGCFVNDSTQVTINPLAQGLASNIINPACNATNGSFDLEITTTGSYTYTVTGNTSGIVDQGNVTGPIGAITVGGLSADTYSVQIVDNSSGCSNTVDNINVQNDPPDFTIVNTSSSNADCTNPTGSITVSLSANVFPITYTLANTADNSVTTNVVNTPNAGTFDFTISALAGGNYDLEVVSSGGCTQLSSGLLLDVPTPVEYSTEPFVELCAPTAQLEVTNVLTPGASFTWTGPNGFTGNGTQVTVSESGTYQVTGSAVGFCDVTETIELSLSIQPIIQVVAAGDGCNDPITLTAEVLNPQNGTDYIFNWDSGETTATIEINQSGTYTVTARNSVDIGCVSAPISTPVALPDPIEVVLSNTPACDDGSPITLNIDVLNGSPTSFQWTRDGLPAGSGQSIQVLDEGTYVATISDGTCVVEESLNVRRQITPEGQLPEREFYCSTRSDNPVLVAGNGFVSYEWTLDGVPYPDAGRTLAVEGPGEYVVTMTTSIGCVQTDSVTIIESCDPTVIAPNAFAPTSAPPNNSFSVFPNDFVDNFEIYIYTRWGELVYQSNSLEFKWDGTFNGQLVPLGTYPYVIRFTSRFEPERGTFEQQGAVTVIR